MVFIIESTLHPRHSLGCPAGHTGKWQYRFSISTGERKIAYGLLEVGTRPELTINSSFNYS